MKLRICRRFEWSWLKYLWLSPLRISVPKFRIRKIVNQVNLCKTPIFHEMLLRPCIKIWKHRAVIGNRMKLGSFSVVKKSIPAWSSMVQRVSPAPSDLQHTCLLLSNLTSTHSHQGREARIGIARNGLLAMRFQRERGDELGVSFKENWPRWTGGPSEMHTEETYLEPLAELQWALDSRQFFQRWTWENISLSLMLYDRLDGGRKRAHSTRQSRLSASQVADPHRVATQRHSQSLCHPGFISSLDLTSFVTFPPGAIFFSCLGSILLRFNFSGSFFQFLTFGSFFLANLFPMPYPSLVEGCPNLVHLDLSDCVMLKNDCFPEFYQLNYL